jgi:glutaredoxin-like protein
MSESSIKVYAANWCGDCRRSRRFLDKHKIPYEWINIDQDPQAEQFVLTTNKGMRSVPTIVFQDGSILVEPSDAELAAKLEL